MNGPDVMDGPWGAAHLLDIYPGSGHEALVTVASTTVTLSCGSRRSLPRTRNSYGPGNKGPKMAA